MIKKFIVLLETATLGLEGEHIRVDEWGEERQKLLKAGSTQEYVTRRQLWQT